MPADQREDRTLLRGGGTKDPEVRFDGENGTLAQRDQTAHESGL